MIQIKDRAECCGCTACYNICPKSAIIMKEDKEGFLYPDVDKELCINCGLCEKRCPVINNVKGTGEPAGYILRNRDSQVLFESTSGGAFTLFAEYVLRNNGIVYGAGYDGTMKVVCKKAETVDALAEMRGSKFVQSALGDIFKTIKKDLQDQKKVLFSGTPCQVAGLLNYLGKKPENLICIDFVCRGVPSPKLWIDYVKTLEHRYSSKIISARFKHKTYGYHTSTMKIDFANGKTYYASGRIDPYMKSFVRELSSRPSCAKCKFKGVVRPSDITIFDCYGYQKVTGKKDDDKGYSSIFVQSKKGEHLFDAVSQDAIWERVSIATLVGENGVMVNNSAKPNEMRKEFYELAMAKGVEEAISTICPVTMTDKLIESIKWILNKTRVIYIVRKIRKKRKVQINKDS